MLQPKIEDGSVEQRASRDTEESSKVKQEVEEETLPPNDTPPTESPPDEPRIKGEDIEDTLQPDPDEEWTEEHDAKVLAHLEERKNPLAKVKKLKPEEQPLRVIGRHLLHVPHYVVEEEENLDHNFFVTRDFISSAFGGSPQGTFPQIGTAKKAKMDEDGFGEGQLTFLNLDYNPYMPQKTGLPGLMFTESYEEREEWKKADAVKKEQGEEDDKDHEKEWEWKEGAIQRLFVRLDANQWLYVGQYSPSTKTHLERREWNLELSETVKRTWVNGAMEKEWGYRTRLRVHLRSQSGNGTLDRKLYREMLKKQGTAKGPFKPKVEPDEMRKAFDRGQERIMVNILTCIDYDSPFQRKLQDEFPTWEEQHKAAKTVKGAQRKRRGTKRVREETNKSQRKGPAPKKRKKDRGMDTEDEEEEGEGEEDGDYEPVKASGSLTRSFQRVTRKSGNLE